MNVKILAGVLIAAVVIVGGWFYFNANNSDTIQAENEQPVSDLAPENQVVETLAVEQEKDYQEQTETAIEPPMVVNDSDKVVRAAVSDLSEPFVALMSPQQQLRKWIVVVDQLAGYKWPTKNLPVSYPKSDFKVVKTDKGIFASPDNSKRWNKLIELLNTERYENFSFYE